MKYNKHKDPEYWRGVFEKFKRENGKYPNSVDLKSIKTVQRHFGGIEKLRILLNIDKDYNRSDISKKINKRANETESEINNYFVSLFGEAGVHREQPIFDDSRTRLDFLIFYKKYRFAVDIFYSETVRSLYGCLDSKLKKFDGKEMFQYPVLLVCMNNELEKHLDKYKMNSGILKKYMNKYDVKIMSKNQMEKYFEEILK